MPLRPDIAAENAARAALNPPTLYYRTQFSAWDDPHAFVDQHGHVWRRHWPWERRDDHLLLEQQPDWKYHLPFGDRWVLLNRESTRYQWDQGFRVASLFGPPPKEDAGRRIAHDLYDCLAWVQWDRATNQIEMQAIRWPSDEFRHKIRESHGPVTAQAAS